MKTQARWAEEEDKILMKFGNRMSSRELTELLPRHTASGIAARRARLGLASPPSKPWTEEENGILAEFAARDANKVAAMLSGRTTAAVTRQRGRLGIADKNVRWTEEEDEVLKELGIRKLIHELATLLPGRTHGAIGTRRARLGIKVPSEYRTRFAVYNRSKLDEDLLCKLDQSLTIDDFDDDDIQILLGSILGDGCIKKNSAPAVRNYLFYEGHGMKQADYVMWKVEQLAAFHPKYARDNSPSKKQTGGRMAMWTVSHPIFTMLRGKFYRPTDAGERGKKGIVPMDLLARLDLLGLMVWYLDDGYLGIKKDGTIGGGRMGKPRPTITAKLFDYDGLVRLCGQLNKRFSLGLHVSRNKWNDGTCNVIRFRREDYQRVIPTWRAYAERLGLPKCMHYKLNMHDPRLRLIEDLNLRTKEGRNRLKAMDWDTRQSARVLRARVDAEAVAIESGMASLQDGELKQAIPEAADYLLHLGAVESAQRPALLGG